MVVGGHGERRRPAMDTLSEDDVARFQCPGGVGHNHCRLMVGQEHGSIGSKTVRNGNKKGKGKSLVLGAQ